MGQGLIGQEVCEEREGGCGSDCCEKERGQERLGSKSLTQQCSFEKHSARLMAASV